MILFNVMDEWIIPFFIEMCMGIMNFVKSLLNLIFDLANITFFRDDIISDLFKRVYIIVGVLMLFKITISCVQYLINPDKMDDKESGFGGVAKRAIIAVLLLAFVPTIFEFAKIAQGAILEALPKVILGQEMSYDIDDMGDNIAYTTTLAFFGYTSDVCNDGSIGGLGESSSSSKFSSIADIEENSNEITSATCNGEKRYYFRWYFCLPAAICLVVILISMTLDVGIRVIKFGLLEILAPIPIASYIDPKTSKKSFDSWVHNCISVYTDLFIRLGVIYLILYLFMIILPSFSTSFKLNDGTVLSTGRSMLVNVAIIIALFMFAKNAPKFICDVLGIKGDGNGGIGDMFKRAAGLAGAGVAGWRTAKSNYIAQKNRLDSKYAGEKNSWLKSRAGAALSSATGASSAIGRGFKMATFDKKGFNDIRKGASRAAVQARDARNDRIDNLYNDEYTWRDYYKDRRYSELGIPSPPGFEKSKYDVMDKIAQAAASEKSFGATKMNETPDTYQVVSKKDGKVYTIATARSYANLQVGTTITEADGTKRIWTVDDQARAMEIQQEIEKKTSYIKTADLLAHNDPTAKMNRSKTMLEIKNNLVMFNNDKYITDSINGILTNYKNKSYNNPKFANTIANAKGIEDILNIIDRGPLSDSRDDVYDYSNAIEMVKSLFEDIRTVKYEKAQAADARAKKTQAAIQNDKKGS